MADQQEATGRRNERTDSSPSDASDDEPKKVKFHIGGDSTPFFDDNEPLVKSTPQTPDSGRSQSIYANEQPSHQVFSELFELQLPEPGSRGEAEWEETARWIRYEEDVEGADHRWGRPHVAFLTFHSLLQLRYCILKGVLMLGARADSYQQICKQIVDAMSKEFKIDEHRAKIIGNALGRKHRHATEARHLFGLRSGYVAPGSIRSDRCQTAPTISRRGSATTPTKVDMSSLKRNESASSVRSIRRALFRKSAERVSSMELMRMLPSGVESAQVFVGKLCELRKVRFCMVRLDHGANLPELLDAPIPIRFIFVIVGPPLPDVDYHEIGRSVATLMSNPLFHDVAYSADSREALLAALDQFLDASLVIPPGEIAKRSLLSVEAIKKAFRRRDTARKEFVRAGGAAAVYNPPVLPKPKKQYDPLLRTGKPFRGVINDVKHRFPRYWSDLTDACHIQCLTSLVFMFFAAFAPAISFGGLLGEKVDGLMGPSEVLVAQCLCGVVWGLLSCQPLIIIAATGPLLLFEQSFYMFCKSYGLEFMVMRVWAGFWVLILAIITVFFEGSFLVRYITRFTEDIFATLIAMIFCFESIKFMIKNFEVHPVKNWTIYCAGNETVTSWTSPLSVSNIDPFQWHNSSLAARQSLRKITGQPDTALLSAVFLLATFTLAFMLRQIRTSHFLGRTLRRAIGDFGVPISLLIVVLFDQFVFIDPYLELLEMPDSFSTTDPSRGWIIPPLGVAERLPWWCMVAAAVPALLAYILIFVEVEITELLLATKERGLRKGSGFHYDLVLVGALTAVCSLMGLPWMCAAAVQSLAHASSLTIMKRKAPGERPEVELVLEQRVTTIGVALLMGACSFLGYYLKRIPLATLFGIFLYLGVISMIGVQLLQRVVLLFVPQKHHPDVPYCKQVRMWRMHVYTLMQVLCLGLLWIVKSFQATSLAFSFVLMLVAVLRKVALPRLFTPVELNALDGHGDHQDDEEKDTDDDPSQSRDFYQEAVLPI